MSPPSERPPKGALYGWFIASAIWSVFWLWDHNWQALVIAALCTLSMLWGYVLGRTTTPQPAPSAPKDTAS